MSSIRLKLKPSTVRSPPVSTNQQFHSRPTEIANQKILKSSEHRSSYFITRLIVSLFQWNMSREGENKLLKLKQNPKLSSFASEKHSFGFLLVSLPPPAIIFRRLFAWSLKFLSFPNNPKNAPPWILKSSFGLGDAGAARNRVGVAASSLIFATIFPQDSMRRQKC